MAALSAMGHVRLGVNSRLLLVAVLVLSAAYSSWHLGRGWVPHDEGALGQSAMRVLQGELPHRDFDEIYTGGLSYLNAAAFRAFGTTLFSMRLVLFAFFLAWIPAVFYIATRLVRPLAAAAVTLLCVAWSLPNYPAPLPSWYNLFLAVIGIAALFRWLEDRRARWLVAAGIMGGLSLLVKVVGLYYVAGVLLFLVFQAHEESRRALKLDSPNAAPRGLSYALLTTVCLLAFSAALLLLVRHQLYPAELVQFVLPGTALSVLLVRNEWLEPAGPSGIRFRTLGRLIAPFVLGFAVPVALFLIPFARAHAIGALFNGVFVLPTLRFGAASHRMPSLTSLRALVPVLLLFAYGRQLAGRATRYHWVVLALLMGTYLIATATNPLLYHLVWFAIRDALPILVLLGAVVLTRARPTDVESPLMRSRAMLLLSVSAVFTLVQFPFSAPIYFCYVAPLVALVAVALLPYARPMAPAVPVSMLVFLIAFAVLRVNTSPLGSMGLWYQPYPATTSLALPRGHLDVPVQDADMYRAAVGVLQQHARGGFTWASPDCPEVYFLSGLRNPTRSLFDFFDEETGRTARILSALDQHGVTAIALNSSPAFSAGIPDELVNALKVRYPFGTNVGKFQIRWQ
ncbi:MAG: ArnT family glycosyltransferase [Gemmatimonadaceae bacterium]